MGRVVLLFWAGVLLLDYAARTQFGSRHGLVALASPSVVAPFAAPTQSAVFGLLWSYSAGCFCALEGAVDYVTHPRIRSTLGVGWCARFIGWMRPCCLERGPDALAVQSGQMVKYPQTLAMAAGPACLLPQSSSS